MASALPLMDPVAGHALAIAAALVLLVGVVAKLRDWPSFRGALDAYRLLPEVLVTPVALALPALELIAAVALLFAPYRVAGAVLALVVLATVTSAVAVNVLRGRVDIDCGCGGAEGRQRLSWGLVLRNAVLMAVIAVGAQPGSVRELGALDYTTLVLASLALYGLYATASQLVANRPGLEALRN